MDEKSLAPGALYILYRVYPEGTEEKVGEHPDFESGWRAGTHAVSVEDKENAYTLYARERRVARFGHNRLIRQVETERLSSLVGGL